ncbi:hypothetical protein R9X50_00763400 [Acrodontium crateriforme]|uniref:EF-hand domain-containing protein n=1 Tax=Acrodontium crateriforme TaxID=150365 RepID=A0AAQ3RAW6_9PEZI|nr:hypothetical protein R9X50_00763400 [Acrodontium crateriforme]
MRTISTTVVFGLLSGALAQHSGHQIPIVPEGADWATRHMIEEHHIAEFDAGSFFNLHDFDSTRELTHGDIYKTYGFEHESTNHISSSDKDSAVQRVMSLFDTDGNGSISLGEFEQQWKAGKRLPDFGFGPGHHGDDEYEYEIHHWELFHDENTREEDLTHPEDIEHFRKHDLMEEAEERQAKMDHMHVVEANIPQKFRRG